MMISNGRLEMGTSDEIRITEENIFLSHLTLSLVPPSLSLFPSLCRRAIRPFSPLKVIHNLFNAKLSEHNEAKEWTWIIRRRAECFSAFLDAFRLRRENAGKPLSQVEKTKTRHCQKHGISASRANFVRSGLNTDVHGLPILFSAESTLRN